MTADEALSREQAVMIHRNVFTGVTGGFVVACILVTCFWSTGGHSRLALWLGAGAVLGVWRLAVWRSYAGGEFSAAAARRWLRQAAWGAGLSGALWAIGSVVFFFPPEFIYHVLFVFAVAMMGITAMLSFGSHARTFLAYFLPTAVPAALATLAHGTLMDAYIGIGMFIYIAVVMRFFVTFNRAFVRSVQLAFENTDLVSQLTVQKEAAESANLAKSRFLAAASHDLRQPMHALTLYLGALEGHDFEEAARGNLANARKCAQTMDEMFRALLDISRLDAGAVQTEVRGFALKPLLERIRMEFAPQAEARGLAFTVRTSEEIVHSDPDAVERILRNLVANAVRYTERGGILVGCRRRGAGLRIAVYDTGPGIAAEEQGNIFEEFYQVGNPERDRSKGIGLGLAIVERLARLLAAPVAMDSRPGRGSMFGLDLPLAGAVQPPPRAALAPGQAQLDMRGLFIVVVDDEDAILAATREVLEQWRCKVVTAASGAAALEQLAASPRAPDALICDFRLRNHETGIDVIDALRTEFNADIPALLVSGDSAPARMREAEANGLRVLHKPFNENSLRLALTQILAKGEPQAAT
ncbi:MAG: hybrid sensor histidine kinase/response regulator [Betaproteobacteria bacterium]|nr:hybrid sensor histidine kinase/response regulator [Betaproteobacteria bacterium]